MSTAEVSEAMYGDRPIYMQFYFTFCQRHSLSRGNYQNNTIEIDKVTCIDKSSICPYIYTKYAFPFAGFVKSTIQTEKCPTYNITHSYSKIKKM